jgi:hypothetical protein
MTPRLERLVGFVLVVVLAGCGSDGEGRLAGTSSPESDPSPSPPVQDVMKVADMGSFAALEAGTYFMDPDLDPSTPLRVVFDISADGWEQWPGAVKFAGNGHVAVSITTVTNTVRHGCRDHSRAVPRVGPSVDDLATALADLAPFRVTSPPTNMTIYGYRGKHLQLTVPDLPMAHPGFAGCAGGNLHSWIAPALGGSFFGYTGPGYTEEFWILDVEGTRLMIAAERSPDSPSADLVEQRAILDSIRIEP